MRAYDKNQKGFSLVELIIVLALLAIILMIVTRTYNAVVQFTRVKADTDSAASIVRGVRSWYIIKSEDVQRGQEFKDFVEENMYLKTIKLSDLKEKGLDNFVDSGYIPFSLRDNGETQVDGQNFYVGVIGKGSSEKFIVTIETETDRVTGLSDSTEVDYDGYSPGVIYIEP